MDSKDSFGDRVHNNFEHQPFICRRARPFSESQPPIVGAVITKKQTNWTLLILKALSFSLKATVTISKHVQERNYLAKEAFW